MALFLYGLALLTIIAGSLLYWTRQHWAPPVATAVQALRDRVASFAPASLRSPFAYTRLPSTFAGDAEAGLSSSTFDLAGNITDGDEGRAGLDDASKAAILKIMKKRRLPFDEARKAYMEQRFRANGIGADGRPRDPKFVSFS
ncbi:protein precursor [Niveomyces insectorum RCEF 264]|uniref:Protein n=1 Tax=Niveomyces insectorum RCEF 264 TaxID=1081102 RepID=A0A167QRG7_9HYPO|nr:protein precursor [Niveomyces insectorum RCEF 264]